MLTIFREDHPDIEDNSYKGLFSDVFFSGLSNRLQLGVKNCIKCLRMGWLSQ